MQPSKRWADARARFVTVLADDAGSASLEFLTAGVLLLVPLVYLVLVLSAVQAASFGVEGAARQAARLYARADTRAEGDALVARAVETSVGDYGIDVRMTDVAVRCHPSPCGSGAESVTVEVSTFVALPLVPAFLEVSMPAGIRVGGSSTQPVSRFEAGP